MNRRQDTAWTGRWRDDASGGEPGGSDL